MRPTGYALRILVPPVSGHVRLNLWVLVLLALARRWHRRKWTEAPLDPTQSAIAKELGLSQVEISYAIKRLRMAQLVMQSSNDVILPHLIEFSVHGARYNYPAVIGKQARWIPTASLVEPLKGQVNSSEGERAWPSGQGTARAQSLDPTHPSAPHAALANPRMYRLLSLLDGIRVGKSRRRQTATDLLVAELRASRSEE